MKIPQLKEMCREFGLKVSGKNVELQDRIRGHLSQSSELDDDFSSMCLEDLQQACIACGLPSDSPHRADLEKSLRDDHSFACELKSLEPPLLLKSWCT